MIGLADDERASCLLCAGYAVKPSPTGVPECHTGCEMGDEFGGLFDDVRTARRPVQRRIRGAAPAGGERPAERSERDAQPDGARQRSVAQAARVARRRRTSPLHFKRIAARAMRQVLVEAARRRHADKRGGGDARS